MGSIGRGFYEHEFQSRVDKALDKVRTILDNTRNPQYPTEVHHEYEDKYLLAEFLTNTAIAAHLSVLDYLGVSSKPFAQLKEWAKTRSVTLRLNAEESCKFLRKAVREQESDTKHVTKAGIFGKFESGTVTKITEYFWQYTVKWELVAFQGVDSDKAIVLLSQGGTVELKTNVDSTPRSETSVKHPVDINILWLLQNTDDTRTPKFSIDRKSKKCRTPRRNEQVERALTFFHSYYNWASGVCSYFTNEVFPQQPNHGLDLSAINEQGVFVPVLPLFESNSPSPKIPPVYFNSFLAEQARSLDEKRNTIAKIFTASEKLITIKEAHLVVCLKHANRLSEAYSEALDYIEDMLRKQLIAALGKIVTPVDFANYLVFHNRKVFAQPYRPLPFSYAVRRPNHSPEGTLSISVQLDDGSISNPISTIVSHNAATRPMFFSINEATKVSFLGDRYLHGYVSHQFAGQSGTSLSLDARSRQFSSFILLVGRIVSADEFDPKHAIIIQNKDELKIPLMLETIPTPKEFKDAIASLSPEQQRFCKAFRSMQLESTLFGVCVIQIKPQLEKVLKLPDDSLTKEIQLTQDLLTLFIKYQIPSDLVSYDGPEENSVDNKIATVRVYVDRMLALLTASKKAELEQAQLEQQMRAAEQYLPTSTVALSLPMSRSRSSGAMEERAMMLPTSKSIGQVMKRGKDTSATYEDKTKERSVSKPKFSAEQSAPAPAPKAPAPAPAPAPSVPAPSTPVPATPQADQPKQQQQLEQWKQSQDVSKPESSAVVDYTKVPTELEEKFEKFQNNALRPTIINPSKIWSFSHQKSLLSEPEKSIKDVKQQEKDRNEAFDLLDGLTKSGVIAVTNAALHVVIASTHCFDKSIIDTVIEDNVNPIEKVENSSLIIASTIHQTEPINLIAPEHRDRITNTSALLITGHSNENNDSGNLISM